MYEVINCAIVCVALTASVSLGYWMRSLNEARRLRAEFGDDFFEEWDGLPDLDTMEYRE